jgi:magnesium transporter
MAPFSPIRSRHPIRVVLSATALLPFMSVRKAAALAIAQFGVAAFFISGLTRAAVGDAAGWFVLAAAGLAAFARSIDLETWSLLIPGGFVGSVTRAFGPRAAGVAKAAALVERILFGALACILVGHYAASVSAVAIAGRSLTGFVRAEDLATLIAVGALGVLWLQARLGRAVGRDALARAIWMGVAIVLIEIVWALVTVSRHGAVSSALVLPAAAARTGWSAVDAALAWLLGFALTLPVAGGGEALLQAARELPPPRVQALRRTRNATLLFTAAATVVGTFLFVWLVPSADQQAWANAPLAGMSQHLAAPPAVRGLVAIALAAAAALVLLPAAHAAVSDAEQMLHRFSLEGTLPPGVTTLHTRFGTPARAIDLTVIATTMAVLASGARVSWLARAYGVAIAVSLALSIAAVIRHRRERQGPTPYTAPGDVRVGRRQIAAGLAAAQALAVACTAGMILTGDIAAIAAATLITILASWFTIAARHRPPADTGTDETTFDLMLAAELSPDQIETRPGAVLVPVRNPHLLAHVMAALQTPGDRDVVVMTARLLDVDVGEDELGRPTPTPYERKLLTDVVALAERVNRPVRLLIVPTRSVVDAIVGTVIRLRASDVFVGESATLSAEDQARLLGEAWERADKPDALDVRLVIHHRSGRSDTYHLGAHPPSFTSDDLDLIHRLWLDAVKAVGPHVHHADVVRAALKQMDEQLSGSHREEAVAAIREIARPAEELAEVLRARDYVRLRDMLRNREAGDLALLLTALSLEDQVVVFRVMPRKDAAAVFEYLAQESQETLLKGMAQDDVAGLLNNMAPDDRTLFLEELPAEATRQLLALLTPAERAVAVTLLGYPERSVGRLMTPNYLSAREEWTVREVLDYVRTHGQDSETLNVIYVVDGRNQLIDDVRIREFLLAPLDRRVAELMDRRFVALKATDDQETAVGVFRQYDRTALPVTDSAGMLIGIVTIDDVLDVAEATATRDIQRIGGSEALDEPYISIAFGRMIQKRAGWLTALFLGEMLTATAMGVFEEEISKAVVLALFVPLIISSGGNSGSQAATLVIRALALGEVTVRDWWRVMRREVLAGLALGVILGSIGFLRISLWSAFSDIYGPHWLLVAITVSVALVGVVLWGTLSGSLLPFLLKRLGFDPAASSAPFVATLVDVTGLVIYFSVALVVLRGTLL